jgi:hypothetical protein
MRQPVSSKEVIENGLKWSCNDKEPHDRHYWHYVQPDAPKNATVVTECAGVEVKNV